MVKALIQIGDNTNRVLNIIKAQHGLRDKGEAIEYIVGWYIDNKDEPELRPEFVEKMKKIMKEKSIRVDDFGKRYGLKDV